MTEWKQSFGQEKWQAWPQNNDQPHLTATLVHLDNIFKIKKLDLHLAFCCEAASGQTTWPLKTG